MSKLNNLEIYPNPSSGVFKIDFFEELFSQVQIFDLTGKEIKNIWLVNNPNSITLDLTDQPAGIYLINIVSEDKIETIKVNKL